MTLEARVQLDNGPPLIEARGLSKHYGSIIALDDLDLLVGHGEIVAIVGDNGAGKSTFAKILSGAISADSGSMFVEGRLAKIHNPLDARGLGIETIYQDLALLPNLDVTTNLFLGRERIAGRIGKPFGIVARRTMRAEAQNYLRELEITIPRLAGVRVEALSGGQRQSVAVARAIVWASKLLIMDEPTAALGAAQSRAVLDLVCRVRDRGTSVIIISHILPHVLEVADRIVVLRHGRKVADTRASNVTQNLLIALIVGSESVLQE